jgi:hypothetical protein
MSVVQQLAHVAATRSHDLKPMLRDFAQLARVLLHPGINCWISLTRAREPEELAHIAVDFSLATQSRHGGKPGARDATIATAAFPLPHGGTAEHG